ncbi:MAG: class I SAM-dependent methyltransferase [Candidatus Buchananbacteria bacterium]|nr:class I SAM-dependent methyltransferase [Candidatus Buchananbacteria bacterium]
MASAAFLFWLFFIPFILLGLGTFALGGVLAAPWVPLWKKDVRRMLELAEVKPGETVYDLGAGDGRIIIIAAKEFGATATGFEVAVLPFLWGYIKIKVLGLSKKAKLKYNNFFNQDLSQADVICVFLTPEAMKKLKPKFQKEKNKNCRIVSYAFKIPDWEPEKVSKGPGETSIYLYR